MSEDKPKEPDKKPKYPPPPYKSDVWTKGGKNFYQYEPVKPPQTILEQADKLINGSRAASYGSAKEQYETIAHVWSALVGTQITAEQAALMMAAMKVVRAFQQMPLGENDDKKKSFDSVLDLAGYAGVVEKILKEKGWW